jgi:hypothetical protein
VIDGRRIHTTLTTGDTFGGHIDRAIASSRSPSSRWEYSAAGRRAVSTTRRIAKNGTAGLSRRVTSGSVKLPSRRVVIQTGNSIWSFSSSRLTWRSPEFPSEP